MEGEYIGLWKLREVELRYWEEKREGKLGLGCKINK